MDDLIEKFELVVRRAGSFTEARSEPIGGTHPFDERDIHTAIEVASKKLFDNGHYSQATFEAFKLLDKRVATMAGLNASGVKLMMQAFSEKTPLIQFNDLASTSQKDEQEGYKFIFSGSVMAIRNPRGHEYGLKETPTQCLDHLSLASMLLRKLESVKKV